MEVRFGLLDADFQGLQVGGLGSAFGDEEKSRIGGAAMASTASFSLRGAARREEGGLWEGERMEGKKLVWRNRQGEAGFI